YFFFFSSRRRHTRFSRDWSSDVCSSDLFRHKIHQGNPQRLSPCALRGCLLGKLHQRKRQHPALAVLIDQIDEIRHRQRKRLPRLPFLNFSSSNGGRASRRPPKPNRQRQPPPPP